MKKYAAAHIKLLSEMSADPTKAARAMMETGKRHFKQTNKQISLNTLDRLIKKEMGTQDVENMSKKFINNRRGTSRDQGYINYVMKRRREDAKQNLDRAKAEYRNTMKYLATVVPENVMVEFCSFMRMEVGKEWREKVQRMKRKIRTLEDRTKAWKKSADPTIEGIKVSDAELEQMEALEAETVVPVYGGVEVEVKEAAALPPKFALHPKVDIKNVETEIEKGI